MPNTSGAYQPFGSGWSNLSNYLTKSNIGGLSKDKGFGAAHMERYSAPDDGASFDDWLSGVGKKNTRDASKPFANPEVAQPETKPTTEPRRSPYDSDKGYYDPKTGQYYHPR